MTKFIINLQKTWCSDTGVRDRYVDKHNRIQSSKINPNIYIQLSFEVLKQVSEGKNSLSKMVVERLDILMKII